MNETASAALSEGRAEANADLPALAGNESSLGDWFTLLKPRVLTLVVFTGWIGLLVAPGSMNPILAFTAVLCITVAAGAAGAMNMWFDRDIDAVMYRTARRPIPSGRVAPDEALAYAVTLAVASVLVMALATNLAAAAALAFSIFFYVVIYTMWLKRRTQQNIVIGGAAGAFPPVIGWMAVTGSLDTLPILMFAIIFAWTPPHFWALALYSHADYQRAGVPMLPVVSGAKSTRRHVFFYTLVLLPLTVLPWAMGLTGAVYGVAAVVLGLGFLVSAWRVLMDRQTDAGVSMTKDAPARACFKFSIIYLFVLFGALAVDHLVS